MLITLLVSFFTTWLLLPVVYLFFSSKKKPKKILQHEVKERKWVGHFIRRPIISYAFIIVLIAIAVIIIPRIATGFLPEMDEGSICLLYTSRCV